MNYIDQIHTFPDYIRRFFLCFTICLSIGYFTGLKFVRSSTELEPQGVEENYLGNEADEEAEVMKFKKPEAEIITTIHTHILSFSLIFFCIGVILISIPMNARLKKFLLFEPFLSTALTFGSIWFLWKGFTGFKYLAIVSGTLLTVTYVTSVIIIMKHTLSKK